MGYILTISGERFDYRNVESNRIILSDIAYALSNQNRYLGHAERQVTVAEHTLRVIELLERRGATKKVLALGALHDAAEAYVGDMPSPLKEFIPEFGAYEQRVLEHIWKSQRLENITNDELLQVKDADVDVLWTETRIPLSDKMWSLPAMHYATMLKRFESLLPYKGE